MQPPDGCLLHLGGQFRLALILLGHFRLEIDRLRRLQDEHDALFGLKTVSWIAASVQLGECDLWLQSAE